MTSDVGTCSSCGTVLPTDAPSGCCPGCLYRLGFGEAPAENTSNPWSAAPATSSTEVQGLPSNRSFGDYELLEPVGHGGMGVVYKARQRSLNRIVALKLLPLGPHAPPETVKRFRAEAVSTAALQHPNIVAIHEVGFCNEQHFISMDYVAGQPLSDLIRGTPLPPNRAATYVKTIAEAIHYAHERGILHRDLKPGNVIIDTGDEPRVTDFGLAKQLDGGSTATADYELTVTGQVLGSPNYMPPEQATGAHGRLSRQTDVYALGAILYHTVTGRPPYLGVGLADVVQQVLQTDPVAPRVLNRALPRDLETICLKCLEKEPTKRYPTAQALAEELGRFLESQPILARPLGRMGKSWRWCRRNPLVAGALGLALLGVGLGFIGASWQWRRAESGELLARRNAYAADMKEVQRTLEENDLGRAVELLGRYGPAKGAQVDLRSWEWRYFWDRSQSDPHTVLCQGTSAVSALAFSADGKILAIRRNDGNVSLWDALTRAPIQELDGQVWRGHKALALSPAGTLLAYGGTDAAGQPAVCLWDWDARRELASLPHWGSDRVTALAFSPLGRTLASMDHKGMVRIWELGSNQVVGSIQTEWRDLYSDFPLEPEPSPRPSTVPSGLPPPPPSRSRYGTSTVWADHYGTLVFSPDGSILAVGEGAPRVRLVDQTTGKMKVFDVATPADGITAMAFSPDSKLLAAGVGKEDNSVHLWNLSTGTETRLEGHKGWIGGLAFSPDGRQLVSVGADQIMFLWNLGSQQKPKRFRTNSDELWSVAWSPDGRYVAAGARDGSVSLWDPGSELKETEYALLPARCQFWEPAFLPDSRSFLTVLKSNGDVVRWDAATFREIETLAWLGSNHTCVAFSSDGRWVAVGNVSGELQVWDYQTRMCVANRAIPNSRIFALLFSARNRFLACGAFDMSQANVGKIWETEGWREHSLEEIDIENCTEGIFSPNERYLAVGYMDRDAAAWDLATNERRYVFGAPAKSSLAVAFSPDGARFAAGSRDGEITVWDSGTKRSRYIGRVYANVLVDMIFSPDGRRLITFGTSPKSLLKIWDVETGREIAALSTPSENFCHLGFSPDGNTLFATSSEGSVLFWHAPTFAEIEAKENRL